MNLTQGIPMWLWSPLPGSPKIGVSSQFFAYTVKASVILLHGTRGGGKTSVQLMRFAKNVGQGWGSFWKGTIIARQSDGLKELITQSKRLFYKMGAKFHASKGDEKWIFPTGEILHLCYVDSEEAYYTKVHGSENAFLGFHELTTFPSDIIYRKARSTNRSSFKPDRDTPLKYNAFGDIMYNPDGTPIYASRDGKLAPPIECETCSTTNSEGVGHAWVKRKFIDKAKAGHLLVNVEDVDGELVETTMVHIFSSWVENLQKNGGYLQNNYIATLKEECRGNKNLEASWIYGSWDISSGGMFDDIWDSNVHVIPRFTIPLSWTITRGFDWGAAHPYYVGWFAEADGTEATLPNGRKWCPPRGTLILIHEIYGTQGIGTNKGLRTFIDRESGRDKASIEYICDWIHREETKLRKEVMVHPVAELYPGPADNQIGDHKIGGDKTIKERMEALDVYWEKSDKSKDSRINGWALLRDRLGASKIGEGAGFYVMQHCEGMIETLPRLPLDKNNPDDVATTSEDHPGDVARYMALHQSHQISIGHAIGSH